jgi:ABC-type multidrug transport system ATPase subunit
MDRRRIQVSVDGRTAVFGPGLPEIVVGRQAGCFIRPDGAGVGERHLVLRHSDDGWTLEALDAQRVYHEGRLVERLKVDRALRLHLGALGAGADLELKPGEDDAGRFQTADFGTVAKAARARAGRRHPIEADTTRIGRDPDSDLVVDDLLVSRRHAELLRRADGTFEVVDLDSYNGTYVNGHRVDRVVLQEHDVVMVGSHSYRLTSGWLEAEVDMGEIAFAASSLTVRLPSGQLLVDSVEFSLDARTMLGIVGPSGAGKSTLVKALAGLVVATEGDVLYDHASLYASYEALRRRIGYVPQDDIVHTELTVRRALEYAADLRFPPDVDRAERLRRVDEVMAELDLSHRGSVRIASLSGGQRKRVNVALELLTKPSLLFLDEATSGLDPHFERSLMEVCRQLADGGRTVIVVTHTMQSLRLCDRLLILARDGQMAYFGPPQLAAAYFDRVDLADVFRTLADEQETSWKERFREHEYFEQYVEREATSPERDETEQAESADLRAPSVGRGWWRQYTTLSARYAAVLTADRRNLALMLLQAPLLGLLMLAALPAHQLSPAPPSEFRLISQGSLVLLVIVLGTTWLGMSNAIREIAKELPIYRRERVAGLSRTAYVASKMTVLGVVTVVQAAVLVAIATSRQGATGDGALIGWPLGELIVVSALAGVAAMAIGLFISAVARTTDRAVTVLPIVLVLLLVLALGAVFPQIGKRPVLNQLGYLGTTQWGFAGMASTVDLNDLQAVTGVLTRVDSIKVDDPAPLFRAVHKGDRGDPRWDHDPSAWLTACAALLGLALAAAVATSLALRRDEAGRRVG